MAGFGQDHMEGLYLPQIPHSPSLSPCPQATVLCDLLLLHILPKRHYYKQKKFKYAEDMGPGEVSEPQLLEQVPSKTSSLCVGRRCPAGLGAAGQCFWGLICIPTLHTQGDHDPAATSSTLGLQENMRTS